MSITSATLQRFSDFLYTRRGLGESTIENYLGTARRIIPLIGLFPTPESCESLVAEMRRAGASYSYVVNTTIALENFMLFRGTPVSIARPRKPKRLIHDVLSEVEITLMIAASQNLRERCILILLAYSGLRNLELCNLRVSDIDVANQLVKVKGGKGLKDRVICVTGSCVEIIIDYLRERNGFPDDRLFVTVRNGNPYSTQDLRKLVRTVARRAGIRKRVYPHLLRHSLATNLINRGAPILMVKDQLGHQFVETTMIYVHYAQKRLQAEYRMFAPSYT